MQHNRKYVCIQYTMWLQPMLFLRENKMCIYGYRFWQQTKNILKYQVQESSLEVIENKSIDIISHGDFFENYSK